MKIQNEKIDENIFQKMYSTLEDLCYIRQALLEFHKDLDSKSYSEKMFIDRALTNLNCNIKFFLDKNKSRGIK